MGAIGLEKKWRKTVTFKHTAGKWAAEPDDKSTCSPLSSHAMGVELLYTQMCLHILIGLQYPGNIMLADSYRLLYRSEISWAVADLYNLRKYHLTTQK